MASTSCSAIAGVGVEEAGQRDDVVEAEPRRRGPAAPPPPRRCRPRVSRASGCSRCSAAKPSSSAGSRFSGASRASDRIRSPGPVGERSGLERVDAVGDHRHRQPRVPLVRHRVGRRAADGDHGVEAAQAGGVHAGHHPRLGRGAVVDEVVARDAVLGGHQPRAATDRQRGDDVGMGQVAVHHGGPERAYGVAQRAPRTRAVPWSGPNGSVEDRRPGVAQARRAGRRAG